MGETTSELKSANPNLRRRSIGSTQRKASLRAPSKRLTRQTRRSQNLNKKPPISPQSYRRRMASVLNSRRNWMRPDRRLSDSNASSTKRHEPKVRENGASRHTSTQEFGCGPSLPPGASIEYTEAALAPIVDRFRQDVARRTGLRLEAVRQREARLPATFLSALSAQAESRPMP